MKRKLRIAKLSERLESRLLFSSLGGIQGVVFNDYSGDGIRQSDEPFVSNAGMFLDLNYNGKLDKNEPTAISNSKGQFNFSNLPAGTYRIGETLAADWEGTNVSGLQRIKVNSGKTTSITVAERQLGTATLTSDNILYVTGTEGPDNISVRLEINVPTYAEADIVINGVSQTILDPNLAKVVIHGLGGNDTILKSNNADGNVPTFIYGDAGNDSITDENYASGYPVDSLDGGDGNDVLLATVPDDITLPATTLNGGNGDDTLSCLTDDGAYSDMNGGPGNDTLGYETGAAETFSGGPGLNTILLDHFTETFTGYVNYLSVPSDVQRVVGEGTGGLEIDCSNTATYVNVSVGGPETINGGSGNDTLIGSSGDDVGLGDRINGGGGNDLISPGAGNVTNYIDGGTGTNALDYTRRTGNLRVFLDNSQPGTDSANPQELDYITGSTIQRVYGGSGNDLIVANKVGGDALFGFGGNDILIAQGGVDALFGGDGDDLLEASDSGPTYIDGGAGIDTAVINPLLDDVVNVETIQS